MYVFNYKNFCSDTLPELLQTYLFFLSSSYLFLSFDLSMSRLSEIGQTGLLFSLFRPVSNSFSCVYHYIKRSVIKYMTLKNRILLKQSLQDLLQTFQTIISNSAIPNINAANLNENVYIQCESASWQPAWTNSKN